MFDVMKLGSIHTLLPRDSRLVGASLFAFLLSVALFMHVSVVFVISWEKNKLRDFQSNGRHAYVANLGVDWMGDDNQLRL